MRAHRAGAAPYTAGYARNGERSAFGRGIRRGPGGGGVPGGEAAAGHPRRGLRWRIRCLAPRPGRSMLPDLTGTRRHRIPTWVRCSSSLDAGKARASAATPRSRASSSARQPRSVTSRSWLLDDEGRPGRPLGTETGYWRPQPDGQVEVVLAHPTGIAEIYLGQVTGTKIEMSTDVVARTSTAKEVTAGHRLYGMVGPDLAWAYDMAAVGQPLQPHLSAQLKRPGQVSRNQ